MSHPPRSRLTPEEETFLQAQLWEEGHLVKGPVTRAARDRGLSLIRILEPANRLSPHLRGESLNRLAEGACPAVQWPWRDMMVDAVLRLLWERLVSEGRSGEETQSTEGGKRRVNPGKGS